jgi:protein-S-isoprenylcysteine O-methyltransferase Ste14
MILMSILVVIVIPNQGKSVGEGEKMMKRHKISLRALQIIPLCIILVSPIFDRNQLFPFGQYERIRIVGIIGVIIGFIIMNWSAYTLGKQFSTDVTIQKNHEVISTGPYKRIRHPRYL